jgi:hypothetical protein
MGKASSAKQDGDRRTRIAAQRAPSTAPAAEPAAASLAGRSSRWWPSLAFVLLQGGNSGSSGNAGGAPGATGASLSALTGKVTSVPAATLDQVGGGAVTSTPTRITGAPLTSGGKPEMLYMGAEYCPYCAAERWSMIVALSRFGTFNGLTTTRSGAQRRASPSRSRPPRPDVRAPATPASTSRSPRSREFTNIPDKATGGYTR